MYTARKKVGHASNRIAVRENLQHQETITGWWCNNHLEKYEFVNGKDDIPYMMENMFQTTKQQLDLR
jgi:hypothetical protein